MALVGAGCCLVNLTDIGAFGVKGRIWFWRVKLIPRQWKVVQYASLWVSGRLINFHKESC
jgi:hypothetical protein